MKKILAVVLVLFSVQVMADGDRWAKIGQSSNGMDVYIDMESAKYSTNSRDEYVAIIWEKWVDLSCSKGNTSCVTLSNVEYNCAKSKFTKILDIFYDGEKKLNEFSYKNAKDSSVILGSFGETLMSVACNVAAADIKNHL